ncbi:hypothetical protein C2E23DRAFT_862319 [Lenzites betulinus]|nr:hypothetical protein C2E23DRAFT_862319 [Lenzites betulinus]
MSADSATFGAQYSAQQQSEMLIRALTGPEDDRSVCTRWWAEELVMGWSREPLCGEEPEVVPAHLAQLSPADLQRLEELDGTAPSPASGTGCDTTTSPDDSASRAPSCSGAQGPADAVREVGKDDWNPVDDMTGEAWMERTARAIDVWADVLCASVDYAHGVGRAERARLEAQGPYADWADGAPVFCSQRWAEADFYAAW